MLSPNARIRVNRKRASSLTVTAKLQVATRLNASVAVQLTCVFPIAKSAPGWGVQLTVTGRSPSTGGGMSYETVDPLLVVGPVVMADGHKSDGGGAVGAVTTGVGATGAASCGREQAAPSAVTARTDTTTLVFSIRGQLTASRISAQS
jgi:hypothetical protein